MRSSCKTYLAVGRWLLCSAIDGGFLVSCAELFASKMKT